MKRVLRATLLVVLGAGRILTQDSDEFKRCFAKADTQSAMHVCANEEAIHVDAELNDVYQRLLLTGRKEAGAVERITAAERAWIAYRDAYIEARYPAQDKLATYGSMYTTDVLLIRVDLTRTQIEALRALLKHYECPECK